MRARIIHVEQDGKKAGRVPIPGGEGIYVAVVPEDRQQVVMQSVGVRDIRVAFLVIRILVRELGENAPVVTDLGQQTFDHSAGSDEIPDIHQA